MNVMRTNTQNVPAEPFGLQIAIRICCSLLVFVPLVTIDLEAHAVLDDEILAAEARHMALRDHVVASALQSKANDRLVAGATVRDENLDSRLKAAGCECSQPTHLGLWQEALADRGLHRRDCVFLVETTHRLPQCLGPRHLQGRAASKARQRAVRPNVPG